MQNEKTQSQPWEISIGCNDVNCAKATILLNDEDIMPLSATLSINNLEVDYEKRTMKEHSLSMPTAEMLWHLYSTLASYERLPDSALTYERQEELPHAAYPYAAE